MCNQIRNYILICISISFIKLSDAKLINEPVSLSNCYRLNNVGLMRDLSYGCKKKHNLYNGLHFEGDILVPNHLKGNQNIHKYIVRNAGKLWPNGRVPYSIDHQFSRNERQYISSAFLFFERNTCIRWVRKQLNDKYWVSITGNENECFSGIGRSERGPNRLNLGQGCFRMANVIHEMMHALGFIHEQSRPDRDRYVDIFYENINSSMAHNFEKHPHYVGYAYNLPYDIHSIMHYDESGFSINGQITMRAKNGQSLGCDREGMKCPTSLDIRKINVKYKCKKSLYRRPSLRSQTKVKWSQRNKWGAMIPEIMQNYLFQKKLSPIVTTYSKKYAFHN